MKKINFIEITINTICKIKTCKLKIRITFDFSKFEIILTLDVSMITYLKFNLLHILLIEKLKLHYNS